MLTRLTKKLPDTGTEKLAPPAFCHADNYHCHMYIQTCRVTDPPDSEGSVLCTMPGHIISLFPVADVFDHKIFSEKTMRLFLRLVRTYSVQAFFNRKGGAF